MKAAAFALGLALASTAAYSETLRDQSDYTWLSQMLRDAVADMHTLCINGRPASRPADVTYGHLPTMPGFVRDHLVPLCAGGEDDADNVWYQEREESYRKDAQERRMCEAMCRGEILPETVRQWFRDGRWRE